MDTQHLQRYMTLERRTPFFSSVGFLTFNQQGPMILRFNTSNSKALVFVPNTREKLGLDTVLGICGSTPESQQTIWTTGLRRTIKPVHDFQPLLLSSWHVVFTEGVFPVNELRPPSGDTRLPTDLVEVGVHVLHTRYDICVDVLPSFLVHFNAVLPWEHEEVSLQVLDSNAARDPLVRPFVLCLADEVDLPVVLEIALQS